MSTTLRDPFLDPASADDPNPLDTADPAWGLPAAHRDHPARVAARAAGDVDELRTAKTRDAAASIRSLVDPMTGRIDNWSER